MYHTQSNSFSMLFSMPTTTTTANGHGGDGEMYSFSSATSPVDCTLSLGTPSTRGDTTTNTNNNNNRRPSCLSSFGWNILPAASTTPPPPKTTHRGGGGGNGGDPLLARRCANCDTTSTPLWRNGPRGPKSLCNACGIRFKKEERRATAAAASGGEGQWAHQAQKTACYPSAYGNEFRFMEDDVVSWRFNVADRPALVHDFTR